jgi:hypothetical protein
VRRIFALALVAVLAACGGRRVNREIEIAAGRRHGCPDRDTWIEAEPPPGNDVGPWSVHVCGRRYFYSRRADGYLVETGGGDIDAAGHGYSDGAGAGYAAPSGGPVHVRGYYRRGTYVRPHTRSRPR